MKALATFALHKRPTVVRSRRHTERCVKRSKQFRALLTLATRTRGARKGVGTNETDGRFLVPAARFHPGLNVGEG